MLVDMLCIRKYHILVSSYHNCDWYVRRFNMWIGSLILFTNVNIIFASWYLIVEYRNFYLLQLSHFILGWSFEAFIDLIFKQPNISIISRCTVDGISSIIVINLFLSHYLSLDLQILTHPNVTFSSGTSISRV